MAHLNRNGINWANQLTEYQRLQNEESMEALGRQSPTEVFHGRKSNAVQKHVSGGRCSNSGSKAPHNSKKKDFEKNRRKFKKYAIKHEKQAICGICDILREE